MYLSLPWYTRTAFYLDLLGDSRKTIIVLNMKIFYGTTSWPSSLPGTIVKIGSAVPSSASVKEGDRVGTFMRGGQSQTRGAFAEYVTAKYDFILPIPDNTSFEQAATMPIPFFTAVQALFLRLGLPEPSAETKAGDHWLLVWSGASSVGQYAVQLGKLAGWKVATTASESNHALLKSYGADAVFDYKDKDVVNKIKEATGDKCEHALDWYMSFAQRIGSTYVLSFSQRS